MVRKSYSIKLFQVTFCVSTNFSERVLSDYRNFLRKHGARAVPLRTFSTSSAAPAAGIKEEQKTDIFTQFNYTVISQNYAEYDLYNLHFYAVSA